MFLWRLPSAEFMAVPLPAPKRADLIDLAHYTLTFDHVSVLPRAVIEPAALARANGLLRTGVRQQPGADEAHPSRLFDRAQAGLRRAARLCFWPCRSAAHRSTAVFGVAPRARAGRALWACCWVTTSALRPLCRPHLARCPAAARLARPRWGDGLAGRRAGGDRLGWAGTQSMTATERDCVGGRRATAPGTGRGREP